MRLAAFCLGLFLALPAAAANKTTEIRLQYVQVSEVELLLSPPDSVPDLSFRRIGAAGPSGQSLPFLSTLPERGLFVPGTHLIPDGISAWTSDPRKNVLKVSGEAAAIERLRSIIKLVDVAPTQVRLSVRLLNLDAKSLQAMNADQLAYDGADGAFGHLVVAVLDPEQVAGITRLPSLSEVEMVTYNNRAMYVRWPRADQPEPSLAALLPRVNGDRTVTLLMPLHLRQVVDGQLASTDFMALRRLAVGQTLLVKPHGEGLTAVVTLKEVITQPEKKRR